jgi:hypothetical protein
VATLVGRSPLGRSRHGVLDIRRRLRARRRFYRTRLVVDVPREKVADEVVKAVQKGRRHVRLPKRAALFPMLCEAPRRTTELLLTGVPHRAQ